MSARRSTSKRRVLVVTGARSEFGLLRPVMEAIRKRKSLELLVAVAGEHLLRPAYTWKEVAADYRIDAKVPMQRSGEQDRLQHAAACARGMAGFAAAFRKLKPDWVVVLGDRIEAFAAASAASIGGIAVGHIHGGDRAEGIADEAMRHAITKLAHLHCAATKASAKRVLALGESPGGVVVTGSPAIDGLRAIRAMSDSEAHALGNPHAVILLHPAGLKPEWEACAANHAYLLACKPRGIAERAVWLAPNFDAGRDAIQLRRQAICGGADQIIALDHLPRSTFIALLKRLAGNGGCLIGNSSAGLIEAAALGLPVVDLGPRQNGREHGGNVLRVLNDADCYGSPRIHAELTSACQRARRHACSPVPRRVSARFGDGHAGPRIAALLAHVNPHDPRLLRKRNSY